MNEPVIIALIGVLGAVVGSLATLSGNILLYYLNAQAARRLDKPRIKLLKDMATVV